MAWNYFSDFLLNTIQKLMLTHIKSSKIQSMLYLEQYRLFHLNDSSATLLRFLEKNIHRNFQNFQTFNHRIMKPSSFIGSIGLSKLHKKCSYHLTELLNISHFDCLIALIRSFSFNLHFVSLPPWSDDTPLCFVALQWLWTWPTRLWRASP